MSIIRCECSEVLVDINMCEKCGREYTKCSNCGLYKCTDEMDSSGTCFGCLEYQDNYQRVEEKEGLLPFTMGQGCYHYKQGSIVDMEGGALAGMPGPDTVHESSPEVRRFAIIMDDVTDRTLSLYEGCLLYTSPSPRD